MMTLYYWAQLKKQSLCGTVILAAPITLAEKWPKARSTQLHTRVCKYGTGQKIFNKRRIGCVHPRLTSAVLKPA